MARLEERLALHGYVLAAAEALAETERKLVMALGQATTIADDEQEQSVIALLTEQISTVRAAARELSDWLDGPPGTP